MPNLKYATPQELGLDADRLQAANNLLRKWTTGPDAPIPGGALLVGRHGKIIEPQFFGKQGPEANAEPIRRDGMFLLASITKPVTYMGAMILIERGELNLEDQVTRYIPEFAANHKEETQVMHLFTHTSGMPDMLPDNAELRKQHAPLKTFIKGAIAAQPLFPPGTDFSYQSMGTLVVAELIQRISGMKIRDFLRKEILDPLEMTSTALGSRGLNRKRLIRVETPEYQAGSDFGWNGSYWQELGVPWGGMFSAPEDFAKICAMLLNGGKLDGVRILSPAMVHSMSTNRLIEQPDLPEPVRRTKPWGLGWKLNHSLSTGSWGNMVSDRAFGHTGATGTMCWMDPATDGFALIFTSAIRSKAPWRTRNLSNMIASAFV